MTTEDQELRCEEVDELAGLYVLGALEAAEEEAVRRHLATCPEPHAEVAAMGGAVPALARAIEPVEPPAELRDRVLAAVAAVAAVAATPQVAAAAGVAALNEVPVASKVPSGSEVDATPGLMAASPRTAPIPTTAPIPMAAPISLAAARDRRAAFLGGRLNTVLTAAAVLLIVVLGATTLVFQRRATDAEARANTLSAAIAAALDPISTVASLRGSGVAAAATGFAAFPATGSGYLVIQGLPSAPAGKTYETWFIAGSTPFPSVLLVPDADGLAIVQGVSMRQGADTVALTIEPASGSQAPTSDPIVVGKMQPGPIAGTAVLDVRTAPR